MINKLLLFLELEMYSRQIMFDDYYKNYYLPKHSRMSTRIMHLMGVIATIIWVACALTLTSGWTLAGMLIASPFVVYPFAWSSHFFCEPAGGRIPAALTSNPLVAKACDLRMCYEMVTGKLDWGLR
jgi:hypothetical protein